MTFLESDTCGLRTPRMALSKDGSLRSCHVIDCSCNVMMALSVFPTSTTQNTTNSIAAARS